jgi:CRP/FNR family transcriptional regulator, cyclic AMP receptor protein
LSDRKTAILKQATLFGGCPPEALADLARVALLQVLPAGAAIFAKGEPGDRLYIVVSGKVRISTTGPDAQQLTLNILGPGALFGEVALADGGARTADASAIGAVELLVLHRRDIHDVLMRRPEVAMRMLAALSERVRWVSARYEDSVFLELPARLAKRLLILDDMFGVEREGARVINLKMSQRDLSNAMHVTRESINRTLKAWSDAGVVRFEDGILTVLDRPRLEGFVLAGAD